MPLRVEEDLQGLVGPVHRSCGIALGVCRIGPPQQALDELPGLAQGAAALQVPARRHETCSVPRGGREQRGCAGGEGRDSLRDGHADSISSGRRVPGRSPGSQRYCHSAHIR
ncbi:hypothetical protein GCM10009793_07870 [Brachybacterium phenoliresistens]